MQTIKMSAHAEKQELQYANNVPSHYEAPRPKTAEQHAKL